MRHTDDGIQLSRRLIAESRELLARVEESRARQLLVVAMWQEAEAALLAATRLASVRGQAPSQRPSPEA